MKLSSSVALLAPLVLVCCLQASDASVFLPHSAVRADGSFRLQQPSRSGSRASRQQKELRLNLFRAKRSGGSTAMAIPGYGVAEQVFVGTLILPQVFVIRSHLQEFLTKVDCLLSSHQAAFPTSSLFITSSLRLVSCFRGSHKLRALRLCSRSLPLPIHT